MACFTASSAASCASRSVGSPGASTIDTFQAVRVTDFSSVPSSASVSAETGRLPLSANSGGA